MIDNGEAQFFNIDLNALYKDTIVEDYLAHLKYYKKQKLSSYDEEKVKDSIDLNAQFCERKFVLNYRESDVLDEGIGYYSFGGITDISHLSYLYDWRKQSITLNRPEAGLIKFSKSVSDFSLLEILFFYM